VLIYDPINQVASIKKINFNLNLRNVRDSRQMGNSGILESPKKINQGFGGEKRRSEAKRLMLDNELDKLAEELIDGMDNMT
jgi:hypothetical protein